MLRNCVIAGQIGLIALARGGLGIPLPLAPMAAVIVSLAFLNLWTWRRLRSERPTGTSRSLTIRKAGLRALKRKLAEMTK